MELVRVEAPAERPVTLEEARAHLRVEASGSPPVHEDDDFILAALDAATAELDGAEGWLGRALVTQTWRLVLDRFPAGAIGLPLTDPQPLTSPPASVVQSVKYTDTSGVVQQLAAAAYRVITEADPNIVEPVYGTSWPATRAQRNAVTIEYTAGYGAAAAVPAPIKSYIKLRVGEYYEHRELVIPGTIIAPFPFYRDSLEGFRARGGWPR